VVWACHRLRIPPVAGFLLTGVLIGPSSLGLVADVEVVEVFAEIGVVALLFTIGLEFSLERLKRIRRPFFLGGSLQAVLTTAAGFALATAAGLPVPQAVFAGFLLTLSSTAIVLKLYAERREIESPQGRVVVGVLLFQDFLIVPLMLVTPVLAGTVTASPAAVAGRFGAGVAAVAAIFLAARYLMPRVLYQIVRTRVREILVLATLGIGLGLALVTEALGFSLALGAFVAGILLSESEYSPQVAADVSPFRDVFNSVFFISIGMLLDLGHLVSDLAAVLGATLAMVAVKALVVLAVVRLLRYPFRTALTVGLGLAQVGEFSFVLAQVGVAEGLVGGDLYQTFLAAAVLSMLATPAMVATAPALALRLGRAGEAPASAEAAEPSGERPAGHGVVVGFGVGGRNLVRVLRQAGLSYRVIELNGDTVRTARRQGEPILFGDAVRREVLERAGIEEAVAAVFAISDPVALDHAVAQARALNPRLYIVVRTRRVDEIEELLRRGADEVVAEEFETSIELFTRLLTRLGVPANVIEAETRLLRGDTYIMLRSPASEKALEGKLVAALAAGTTAVFFLEPEHAAVGRTLEGLALRRRTGASVIAVVRGEQPIAGLPPDLALAAGDTLVLVGGHAEVRAAFEALAGG
jgi:CPA2 family monovalent cation:H+ antiporter-2